MSHFSMFGARMFAALFGAVLIATFLGGYSLAQDAGKDKPAEKAIPADTVKKLRDRHKTLMVDVEKIEMAAKHIVEIREQRATGLYIINEYELKMERTGKKDFHIFMERYRNDTLNTLALLDSALGKQAYVDPLVTVFGERLQDRVTIVWEEWDLEDVIEELETQYDVSVEMEGSFDEGHTISFEGEMTLLAALLQIENLFDVRMRVDGEKLVYVIPEREDEKE
jgi:hypothetical protein